MSISGTYYSFGEVLPARGSGQKLAIRPTSNLSVLHGQLLTVETGANTSEVQTLTESGSPTGGTFQISFNGQVTAALGFNASAAQVQTALAGLPNVGNGNVACTGGPLNTGAVTVTFQGDLANLPQPLLVVTNAALTGGTSPAVTPARTTGGVGYGRFKLYAGSGVPVVSQYDFRSDEKGRVIKGQTGTPQFGYDPDIAAWIGGLFRNGDLTGLDAPGVTSMGARWITGSLSDPNALLLIPGAQ